MLYSQFDSRRGVVFGRLCLFVCDVVSKFARKPLSYGRETFGIDGQSFSGHAAVSVENPDQWSKQEAQLSQRGRAMLCVTEYFAKSQTRSLKRIIGFTTMRYINRLFTYLLTYSRSLETALFN